MAKEIDIDTKCYEFHRNFCRAITLFEEKKVRQIIINSGFTKFNVKERQDFRDLLRDAINGVIKYHKGYTEFSYFTNLYNLLTGKSLINKIKILKCLETVDNYEKSYLYKIMENIT